MLFLTIHIIKIFGHVVLDYLSPSDCFAMCLSNGTNKTLIYIDILEQETCLNLLQS